MGDLDLDLEHERQLLEAEQDKWTALHLPDPQQFFSVDILHLTARLDALTIVLQESGIIDKDQYLAEIFKQIRERLEDMRPKVVAARSEAERARISVSQDRRIIGPNGHPL